MAKPSLSTIVFLILYDRHYDYHSELVQVSNIDPSRGEVIKRIQNNVIWLACIIRQFLVDIQTLLDCEDSQPAVDETYQRLSSVYTEDSELDFTALIESTYNNRLERLKELDDGWKKKYIEIDIDSMDQHQLDQWKRDAQPWPAFLSKATQEKAVIVLHRVEEALSRQRLNYIVSLIDQLTAEEKDKLLKMLR